MIDVVFFERFVYVVLCAVFGYIVGLIIGGFISLIRK